MPILWPLLTTPFFASETIPGTPLSYPEHLEAVVAAVLELQVNKKQTDIHT